MQRILMWINRLLLHLLYRAAKQSEAGSAYVCEHILGRVAAFQSADVRLSSEQASIKARSFGCACAALVKYR